MRAEDHRVVIGRKFERPHTRLSRLFRKRVEHGVPVGFVDLQRTMEHVACKERLFRARSEGDCVRKTMARCRMECESRDRLAPIDLNHIRQSRFNDWLDAILLYLEGCPVAGGLILRVGEVRVLSAGKYIPGFGKRRYPASPFQPRVPAHMIDVKVGEQDVVYVRARRRLPEAAQGMGYSIHRSKAHRDASSHCRPRCRSGSFGRFPE